MSKSKCSPEWRIERAKECLAGSRSAASIAREYGLKDTTLLRWAVLYKEQGPAGFLVKERKSDYSKEFKEFCVEAVLNKEITAIKCAAKYGVSSQSVIYKWISKYNANRELKDYGLRRRVYMAEARRKTTIEERKSIVKYCIDHNRDYVGTAETYGVSYDQVYRWVNKYLATGENALVDNRGRHKTDDEVSELERLRRENKRLKRQLEEQDMLMQLLKKVKEFEGM